MKLIYDEIDNMDVNALSPIAALNKLYELKNMIINGKRDRKATENSK